jgi:hypothetical protein
VVRVDDDAGAAAVDRDAEVVPAPVIVLPRNVTLEPVKTSTAVLWFDADANPEPVMVVPVTVPVAPPTPNCKPFCAMTPGSGSGGPMVLFVTLNVICPDAVMPFFWYPDTCAPVTVTVRAVPASALARIAVPAGQPLCWVMPVTVTLVIAPLASLKKMPYNLLAQFVAKPVPCTVTFWTLIDVPALVTTPPLKEPPAGSCAVIVWPAPSSVMPSGIDNDSVVSQLALNVNVVPERVPAQPVAIDTVGTAPGGVAGSMDTAATGDALSITTMTAAGTTDPAATRRRWRGAMVLSPITPHTVNADETILQCVESVGDRRCAHSSATRFARSSRNGILIRDDSRSRGRVEGDRALERRRVGLLPRPVLPGDHPDRRLDRAGRVR